LFGFTRTDADAQLAGNGVTLSLCGARQLFLELRQAWTESKMGVADDDNIAG
jgi:hypothetical protein